MRAETVQWKNKEESGTGVARWHVTGDAGTALAQAVAWEEPAPTDLRGQQAARTARTVARVGDGGTHSSSLARCGTDTQVAGQWRTGRGSRRSLAEWRARAATSQGRSSRVGEATLVGDVGDFGGSDGQDGLDDAGRAVEAVGKRQQSGSWVPDQNGRGMATGGRTKGLGWTDGLGRPIGGRLGLRIGSTVGSGHGMACRRWGWRKHGGGGGGGQQHGERWLAGGWWLADWGSWDGLPETKKKVGCLAVMGGTAREEAVGAWGGFGRRVEGISPETMAGFFSGGGCEEVEDGGGILEG